MDRDTNRVENAPRHPLRTPSTSPGSFADALRWVDALGKALLAVRQVDPRRVPHEDGRALHATSRVWSIWKCQVSVPPAFGRLAGSLISSALRIIDRLVAVPRLIQPRDLRFGQHVFRIHNSPEPATIISWARLRNSQSDHTPGKTRCQDKAACPNREDRHRRTYAGTTGPCRRCLPLRRAPRGAAAPDARYLIVIHDVDFEHAALRRHGLRQPDLHARVLHHVICLQHLFRPLISTESSTYPSVVRALGFSSLSATGFLRRVLRLPGNRANLCDRCSGRAGSRGWLASQDCCWCR